MNRDILEGKWKELKGHMKTWWAKLTEDDLKKAEGNTEKLIGILQQKYGYTREQAEAEVQKRVTTHEMENQPVKK